MKYFPSSFSLWTSLFRSRSSSLSHRRFLSTSSFTFSRSSTSVSTRTINSLPNSSSLTYIRFPSSSSLLSRSSSSSATPSSSSASSSTTLTTRLLSERIVHRYDTYTVENFQKTLYTILRTKSFQNYQTILSTIGYKANSELKELIDWLQHIIQTRTLINLEKKRNEKETKSLESHRKKLSSAYTMYWEYKTLDTEGKYSPVLEKMNDPRIHDVIDELLNSTSPEILNVVHQTIQNLTNIPTVGKRKLSKGKIVTLAQIESTILTLIERYSSFLPQMYPLLSCLELPLSVDSQLRNKLEELNEKNEKIVHTIDTLLLR